jgi:Gnt-I system high-affinity gluconate transporter
MTPELISLLPVLVAVFILTLLVAWARVQPFIAFVVAALTAALMSGMPLISVAKSLEHGIGDTVGSLAVIVCLGAVYGKLISDSGAAQRIAMSLVGLFGSQRMALAMTLTGFIVGIPLFYNVGFVLMVPLIFSLVYQSGRPAVALGIPLLAGLSIAHGFLPPHPSPTALVQQFHADLGLTLIYGLIVGIPTLIVAGPIFALTVKGIKADPPRVFDVEPLPEDALPGTAVSFLAALLPVILLASATAAAYLPLGALAPVIAFVGSPMVVMLISYVLAVLVLGTFRGKSLPDIMKPSESALRDIAPILLIIAGAGGLKQVFIDSGVSGHLGQLLSQVPLPPLVLGWGVAMVVRICLGSATVAGLTAAGLVAPLVATGHVNPNLMVLAIGAGSLMCSHVNDSGFWMFKQYFGLSLKDTFRSWSLMETLVGIVGLLLTLGLSRFV